MILPIFRKEVREYIRTGMALGALLGLGVLFALAAIVGAQDVRAQASERAAANEVQRERWLERDAVNAHVAAHAGTTVYRPPSPLAAFDPGLDRYLGSSIFLEAHRINPLQGVRAAEGAPAQRLSVLSVAFVLQVVVPLLLVLLTFGSLARERERGVLRMVVTQGVSPRQLAVGKTLACVGVTLIALLPGALILVLMMPAELAGAGAAISSRADLLVRAAGLGLTYAVYLLVFALLGLAVSARSGSPAAALTKLLALWFFVCLGVPRLAIQVAQGVAPSPTGYAVRAAIDSAQKARPGYFDFLEEGERELTAEYGVATLEELPVNLRGYALARGEAETTEVMREYYGQLHARQREQQSLYRLAGLLSPAIPAQLLSMSLAETNYTTFLEFDRQAEDYRTAMVAVMNDHDLHELPTGQGGFAVPQAELYARVPPFEYVPDRWMHALEEERTSLLLLAAWGLVVMLIARRSVVALGRDL